VDEIEGSSLGDMNMWSTRFRQATGNVSILFS